MNYENRDTYGMYKSSSGSGEGPGPRLMGADTLIGNDVCNLQGDDLGSIKEIMLDMQTGRIAYAVLSFGGVFGMGEKLFAVPWNALTLNTHDKRFEIDVDKNQLENAPGFNKDRWPDMADMDWEKEIHAYYGTQPYSDTMSHDSMARSRAVGREARGL